MPLAGFPPLCYVRCMAGEHDTTPERAVDALVEEYRQRCLWFLREDYYPRSDAERLKVLDYIQRHGDREAFLRAAAGKDPGFSPAAILEQAARSARYSREEVEALSFDGPAPDAAVLAREWRSILAEADEVVRVLPAAEVGTCVLGPDRGLYRGDPSHLRGALEAEEIRFHRGRIGGALPELVLPARG